MTTRLRLSVLHERLRASLWLWPAISVTASVVVGTLLPALEGPDARIGLSAVGTPEGARAVLSTVAGSTITVTGLTFSLTVVALQVASSQFTPRVLGSFLADRGNQAVLSVFLSTFVYSLTVLRSVRSVADGVEPFVPDAAVALALVLTLLSVAMLVYFFHHLTQQLRVESVLAEVQSDTLSQIRRHLPLREEQAPRSDLPEVPEGALTLRALGAGHLQAVNADVLERVATDHDLVVRLRPVLGAHVTEGTTLAWAWAAHEDTESLSVGADELARAVHQGIHLGRERTLQQDVAFGVRQLVDIAARALSPGVNDPTTAVATIGAVATVMAELTRRRLEPIVRTDEGGLVRAAVPQPSFAEVLALACDQPRRYGREEPAVLAELLRMLTDLAELVRDGPDRRAVRAEIERTIEVAERADLSPGELERVRTFARHAWAALERGARAASVPNEVEEPAS